MTANEDAATLQQLNSLLAAKQLEHCVFFLADERYQSSLNSYFSNQERCLTPLAIARPHTDQEVSSLIKAILLVRENTGIDVKFAVRSGGHCVWPGAANIDNGITIDLRELNHIDLHHGNGTVDIGAGADWGDVYNQLSQSELTVPGGRVADVGVGGLTLGGFVCDNVVSYEIVLANGSLENVTQESYPDLRWALKGGGSNFGIVTKFTMRTFAASNIFGGCFLYPLTNAKRHIKAFYDFANVGADCDEHAGAISVYSFRAGQGRHVFNTLTHTEPEEKPAALSGFLGVDEPVFSIARVTTQYDLAFEQTKLSSDNFQNCYMTTIVKVDEQLLNAIFEIWEQTVPEIEHVAGICWAIGCQVLHSATTSKSASLGGNCMGLDGAPPLVIVLLTNFWENAYDNEAMVAKGESLLAAIEGEARRRDAYSPFKYLNYAWGDQDVFAGYGEENKTRLQQIARKYDPQGFYQTVMPGGFKLL